MICLDEWAICLEISNLCIKIAFLTEILNKTIRPGNDEIVAKAKVGYIHV